MIERANIYTLAVGVVNRSPFANGEYGVSLDLTPPPPSEPGVPALVQFGDWGVVPAATPLFGSWHAAGGEVDAFAGLWS